MKTKVLMLDRNGSPVEWIDQETAISMKAAGRIVYELGPKDQFVFRGGINRTSGKQSIMTSAPIIAVKGTSVRHRRVPFVTNWLLFERDDHRCVYCGKKFHPKQLTRDHIYPRARGGKDSWTNLVTCCKLHNNLKDSQTVEEFGMPLQFTPYELTFAEFLFLETTETSLPVQIEYLLDFFPENSRIRQRAENLI